MRRPRGTLISVHHSDYRHKDGLKSLTSTIAERWARRQASSLSLECSSLEGIGSAAAAVGRDNPLRWIADTGSAFDLIKEDEVARRGVTVTRQLPSNKQVTLTTANGKTKVGTVAPMQVPVLGRISPLLLKETPAAITVGQRCMDKGWAFHWPTGQSPYMVDPEGKIIPLVVENYVPYLYEDDMDDPKNEDSDGGTSSKSTSSSASITTASSSSTSSYGNSPNETEWGRVGWDPYNTELAADDNIDPPSAATPAAGRSPWASSVVGGGAASNRYVLGGRHRARVDKRKERYLRLMRVNDNPLIKIMYENKSASVLCTDVGRSIEELILDGPSSNIYYKKQSPKEYLAAAGDRRKKNLVSFDLEEEKEFIISYDNKIQWDTMNNDDIATKVIEIVAEQGALMKIMHPESTKGWGRKEEVVLIAMMWMTVAIHVTSMTLPDDGETEDRNVCVPASNRSDAARESEMMQISTGEELLEGLWDDDEMDSIIADNPHLRPDSENDMRREERLRSYRARTDPIDSPPVPPPEEAPPQATTSQSSDGNDSLASSSGFKTGCIEKGRSFIGGLDVMDQELNQPNGDEEPDAIEEGNEYEGLTLGEIVEHAQRSGVQVDVRQEPPHQTDDDCPLAQARGGNAYRFRGQ